ncbi:hypothetical protein EIP86_009712 [Pleurotus ostreatoroseus]|nr:hypothetical protein EIP86_009712 [Pleurotus ostreatoroseus]
MLEERSSQLDEEWTYRIIAIDPLVSRREKLSDVLSVIKQAHGYKGEVSVEDIENSRRIVDEWTGNVGCDAVLEVREIFDARVALTSSVLDCGKQHSVGVHQGPPLPFTGREMYDKNVSFDFGRCPVRAMLPIAAKILLKRQDVFGGIGERASLIEKIVNFDNAAEIYESFDKGKTGKVLFDPWL